jgi:FkbM family methyltransferase
MSERFVSYAQNREDVVLARALGPDERGGFYVDVGAGHPVYDSVTKAFSDRGWRGVNVEPLVEEHALLASSRPLDVNLNVAVGAVGGVAKLYEGPPDNRGSSTAVPELAEAYRAEGQDFVAREVRMRTLASIADEHVSGPVDFLKVDVEGMEREVLVGADWEWFRPRVVVVESTVPNTTEASHESWEPLLVAAGYWFALFDGINRFYVRDDEPELRDRIAAPANVLDDYVVHTWLTRVQASDALAEERRVALDRSHAELADLARRTRVLESRAAALEATIAELTDALGAAQFQTARALADRTELAYHAHSLQVELDAVLATKTFRHTARLRDRYARMREMARRFGA